MSTSPPSSLAPVCASQHAEVVESTNCSPADDVVSSKSACEDRPASEYKLPYGAVTVVLAVELCERLTYYTVAGTQKTYLNKQLGYEPSVAASINSVFSMLCYMWCLPGGLGADVFGRYKAIVPSASLYAAGTVLVAVATFSEYQDQLKALFFVGALGLIPLGTGGIKPNICNFGADQIGDETERQREDQKRYFSYFYMSINVGVMIAFGGLVNISTHGLGRSVPLEEGYLATYIVAAASMTLAVGLFVFGTKYYKRSPGGGVDGFVTMCSSVGYSVRNGGGVRAVVCIVGWVTMPMFFACTMIATLSPSSASESRSLTGWTSPLTGHTFPNEAEASCGVPTAHGGGRRLDTATSGDVQAWFNDVALVLGCTSCVCLVVAHQNNSWIKSLPKARATNFTLEEVRAGFATVPLIIVVNVSFNLAYNAMNNAFPSQACQMNTLVGGSQLNGAFFNLGDAIAIILFTPLFESIALPLIGRLKRSPVRLGQKICCGLLVAASGNLVAAWLELERKRSPLMCWEPISECAPNGIHMRDMNAFWMFIPFALIGAAEILVNPCMLCYCYLAAPPKVPSMAQAINLFFQGSVSNAFTATVTRYFFPNDFDSGHLEYFYFANVICALVGVLIYYY